MKIKRYNGPFCNRLRDCYPSFSHVFEVGEEKSIQGPTYDRWYERYKTFETRPTDVWVISFPKAGTTWTQELVWCVLQNMESDQSKEVLAKRFPFFEWDSFLPEDTNFLPQLDEDDPCCPGVTWKLLQTMDSPRTIKSHMHMALLPSDIRTNKAKMVYICRDPRDVCVSYFYMSVKLDGFMGNFSEFFEHFVNDIAYCSPYWRHVLDFWEKRDEENILFLRYEELQENLNAVIWKVAEFLGKELSEEYVKKMEKHLSFSSMSENKATNNENLIAFSGENSNSTIKFMRNGKVGDWKSHFNKKHRRKYKQWTERQLKHSDFPFYQDFE